MADIDPVTGLPLLHEVATGQRVALAGDPQRVPGTIVSIEAERITIRWDARPANPYHLRVTTVSLPSHLVAASDAAADPATREGAEALIAEYDRWPTARGSWDRLLTALRASLAREKAARDERMGLRFAWSIRSETISLHVSQWIDAALDHGANSAEALAASEALLTFHRQTVDFARADAHDEAIEAIEKARPRARREHGGYDGDRVDDGMCEAIAVIRELRRGR